MKFYTLFISLAMLLVACQPTTQTNTATIKVDDEITIEEVQKAYQKGTYTIESLVTFYLERIEEIDKNKLNAVLTVNPSAIQIAIKLDQEMKEGKMRGPLHGIPVLLKDNIDTGDGMACTAGSVIMKNSFPEEDSPLAAQLRAAGAVILGKTNLSEWANFHSSYSASGWSGLGGQTNNPYDLSRSPCGSSAGSGVAVASNLTVLAIGTETNGSIVCPSTVNGIVGIKPTVGLISRTGIIPISKTQDTGGPMARNLTDAVLCLGALTAIDSVDEKTLDTARVAYKDYAQFLNVDGLEGKRLGFYKSPLQDNKPMTALMEQSIQYMESKGATVVLLEEFLHTDTESESFQVLLYEFKAGLNSYFSSLGDDAPVKSLEELIEKTLADTIEMKYFDHALLEMAQEKGDLNSEAYKQSLKNMLKYARNQGIDKVMDENDLDAIIAPTGSPAWKTDHLVGDNYTIYSSSPAAIAGYPNITIPMGMIEEMPVGISFLGRAWSEKDLIAIAYAYEQGTKHRRTPRYLNSTAP